MKQCLPLTQNKEERGTWGLKAEQVWGRCKLFSAAPLRRQVDMFLLISSSYKLLLQFKEQEWFNVAEKHFVESTVNLCLFLCFSHKPTVNTGAVQRNVPPLAFTVWGRHTCVDSCCCCSISLWHIYHLLQCTEFMFTHSPELRSHYTAIILWV